MRKEIMKRIATLNAIADVADQLAGEDEAYGRLSKVANRMAELKTIRLSPEMTKFVLHQEGLLTDEEFLKLLNDEGRSPRL